MHKFRLLDLSIPLFFLYLLVIQHATPAAIGNNKQGLYSDSDDIVLLNATNIKATVYGSQNSWLVEFYSSWCGHCQRFAPTWKTLAKDILVWKDIVAIAAIDCANENNTPTCRDFEVISYPTIKYIPVQSRPQTLGVEINRAKTVDAIKKHLINQLQKEQLEGRGQTWPNIIPYKTADTVNLWKSVPTSTNRIYLIFENLDSTLGAEIILDFHTMENVYIRRVFSDNEFLSINLKVQKFPSLLVLSRNGNQTKLNINTPTREFVRDLINEHLGIKHVENVENVGNKPNEQSETSVETATSPPLPIEPEDDVLHLTDLEKALQYSLYNEIQLSPIDEEKLTALKNYFDILKSLFPFGIKGYSFMERLSSKIENKNSINKKNFHDILTDVEADSHWGFSKNLTWKGCKGSSEKYRGYNCGMWSMFHMLTANFADSHTSEDPAKVLKVIYGYVKHFFGCWDCSNHFLEMAERNKIFQVKTKDEAVLWLWRAHNEVNARLSGDLTEDPFHKKIQYPSVEQCSTCRHVNGSWDEKEVLAYLKKKYTVATMKSEIGLGFFQSEGTKSKSRRSYVLSDEFVTKKKGGWDFTIFDISLCVVLYVASMFVLILACIKFAVKRNFYKRKTFMTSFLSKA